MIYTITGNVQQRGMWLARLICLVQERQLKFLTPVKGKQEPEGNLSSCHQSISPSVVKEFRKIQYVYRFALRV